MSERHRRQWEALGASDPYWAVLTDPTKRHGKWDKEEFFRTGAREIDGALSRAAAFGMPIRSGIALDYGCGVGRLTRALAERFERVIGVDISAAMLAQARAATAGVTNIQYLRTDGETLAGIADGSVDLLYSCIVLQHAPRATQRRIVREFCRVLRPGGTLIFQTPHRQNLRDPAGRRHFLLGSVARRLRSLGRNQSGLMEMHTLPRRQVERLLETGGVALVRAERYDACGPAFVSYRYFGSKR